LENGWAFTGLDQPVPGGFRETVEVTPLREGEHLVAVLKITPLGDLVFA
jgi:hypothetical protein